MSVSVCVAFRNDKFIYHTLSALCNGVDPSRFEVLVVDDFSDEPLVVDRNEYPNVRVIRSGVQRGVGQSFDIGVKFATGDTIVLMGSDVIVKDSTWIDTVSEYVSMFPKGIGCSTCISGDPLHLTHDNPRDSVKRYGAGLKPLAYSEDISSDNPLSFTSQYVIDLFEGKWRKRVPTENINEVPSLMSAFYFCRKEWYNYIGGFDNAHRFWGGLEAWLSLKTWLAGGVIHNVRDFETLHIWSKNTAEQGLPNGRGDWRWFNKFFVAHTQLPEDLAKRLIDKVYSLRVEYELYTYPFNLGKKLIRQHWNKVVEVRERNKSLFVHDFAWFCEKFNIDINF